LTRHGKIELTLSLSFEEGPWRVRTAAPVETQQDVIVAVKYWDALKCGHQKYSRAGVAYLS
jgi:hypothetical protein